MDTGVLATRTALAVARIEKSSGIIAAALGIDNPVILPPGVTSHDPRVMQLLRMEGINALLDAVNAKAQGK